MSTAKASQVIAINTGTRVARAGDPTHKRGTKSFASFQLIGSTYDADDAANGIGGLTATNGGADFIVVGQVSAKDDVVGAASVSTSGVVLLEGLHILTNKAITIGTAATLQLGIFRLGSAYADRLSTGTVDTYAGAEYDVEVIGGTVATGAAITSVTSNSYIDKSIYAQEGDLIVLFSGGAITADDNLVVTVNATFTKLTPGARLSEAA